MDMTHINIYYTGAGSYKAEHVYNGYEFINIMQTLYPTKNKTLEQWLCQSGAMILISPEEYLNLDFD